MQKIKRGEVTKFAFDWRDERVLRVTQDEAFQVETDDALSGLIGDDSDDSEIHDFRSPHVLKLQDAWPPKNITPSSGRSMSRAASAATRWRSSSIGCGERN